ncbi:hypothetical protein QVD17_00551 [Tagetes erecta]|uniref:HAT C-terminal dimerisation domain-containing protein n=1 Tax=Tagetes erecta TaxID=13708 RepID=A0AAD8L4S2_TARER|nr:hypothetical protein QVD17_00547 [Tagetes erecta]KAK1434797.1 hypothetical protein QVD17_00551 [Tagetes erecta]
MNTTDMKDDVIIDVESDGEMESNDPKDESQSVQSSSPQGKKRKRLTSDVWKSFTILKQEPNQPLFCNSTSNGASNGMSSYDEDESNITSIFKEFDLYDNVASLSSKQKCQLLEYLDEPRIRTTSFHILDYWKAQQYRYPDVARLAMDILCVPVSTVASESAFSLGGRILDQYRNSTLPSTVEALICTRDWLYAGKGSLYVDFEAPENVMSLNIEKDDMKEGKSNEV